MSEKVCCPIKLNLFLRVLSKNARDFHEIFTIFCKKSGKEGLTICPQIKENMEDIIDTRGARIYGVNLVTKVLMLARKEHGCFPPLHVIIDKVYPSGSGIGAGSGNAAAMIRWLGEQYGVVIQGDEIATLGADVAFLASSHGLALASGVGDILSPLEDISNFTAVLAFPKWRSGTKLAYKKLDRLREEKKIKAAEEWECKAEAQKILAALASKDKIGLLPNDFLAIFAGERLVNYIEAFDIWDSEGALAWGLSGSGSAVFALFPDDSASVCAKEKIERLGWIQKAAILE